MRQVTDGSDAVRLLLKLLALLIFGPIILGLLIVLGIAALVAVPILWEQMTARFSAPPDRSSPPH